MKKYIALAIACAALAAGVSYLPAAVEASVPAAVSISPTEVYYSESVNTSGTLCYIGQGDVTSALPLVLSEFAVEEGDHVEVGDVIARVDRKASETFISSLGKVSQLAAATARHLNNPIRRENNTRKSNFPLLPGICVDQ